MLLGPGKRVCHWDRGKRICGEGEGKSVCHWDRGRGYVGRGRVRVYVIGTGEEGMWGGGG